MIITRTQTPAVYLLQCLWKNESRVTFKNLVEINSQYGCIKNSYM